MLVLLNFNNKKIVEEKLKKIISIIGIICLVIVLVVNLIFTVTLGMEEVAIIKFNSFIYLIFLILTAFFIFVLTKLIDENLKTKSKKIIFTIFFILFILFNIIWIVKVRPPIIGDTGHVCDLAESMYKNDLTILSRTSYAGVPISAYMQGYRQQISLAFVFSLFFRLIHSSFRDGLRIFNVLGNLLIIISLYKIVKELSKDYKVNKSLLVFSALTFFTLPLTSTFVYGDTICTAFCLLSVYFIMKYTNKNNIKYVLFSSLSFMMAYIMRMNSLIFLIAIIMYLGLYLLKEISLKNTKEVLKKLLVIILFIIISILPAILIQNYYLRKFNLDKNSGYPKVSFLLMAMEESPRANGWYNEKRGEYALANPEKASIEYKEEIKNRLNYFKENLGYTFKFYTMKITSMWAENTYAGVNVNTGYKVLETTILKPLNFYQKALMILWTVCSIIVLIQNRKNLSNELILLLTIFIGGFCFHILWEAKSRYIIPYVLVLIPISSVSLKNFNKVEK